MKDLKIVKKAYTVKYYPHDDLICYGKDKKGAFKDFSTYGFLNVDIKDIDIERKKSEDIVEFEGKNISRKTIVYILHNRKLADERNKKLSQFSDNDVFLVQKGYIGNSILFCKVNNAGYTTNVSEAHRFTKAEIFKNFIENYNYNVDIWHENEIIDKMVYHAHCELVNRNNSF